MRSTHNLDNPKAFFLVKNGSAYESFSLQNFQFPAPRTGEVVIENEGFGLNFAEVMARLGLYREAPPIPFVPGYDCVGRVIAIGDNVSADWVGKRVVALARFGTYATHCVTRASGIAQIPDDMDAAAAAALGVQYTTAFYAAMHAQRLMSGERVLVHAGAGGVGTALIQFCKMSGCEVFATAGSAAKLELMRANGADHVINYKAEDYELRCKQILGKRRLDASFNAIAGTTFKKDMRLLGTAGRMVLFGAAERAASGSGNWPTIKLLWQMGLVLPIMLMAKSRTIVGVNLLKLADYRPDIITHCMGECVRLYAEGKINPTVGGVYEAGAMAEAHHALESRMTSGKIFIKW